MYGLEDPLQCLYRDPPKKSEYREKVLTKITAFHEKELRRQAESNSNMTYLNVSISGLRGRHHPSLSYLLTAHDVQKSQPHIKMLCGDYFTYEKRSNQSGGSPHCRSCSLTNQEPEIPKPSENLIHILTECSAYSDIRDRILPEFSLLCQQSDAKINFESISLAKATLCQLILDPISLNLGSRINVNDPLLTKFFKLSRDFCFAIHTERMKVLKQRLKQG